MLGIGRSIGDPNQRTESVFSVDSNHKDFAEIKKGEPHFLTQAQVPVDIIQLLEENPNRTILRVFTSPCDLSTAFEPWYNSSLCVVRDFPNAKVKFHFLSYAIIINNDKSKNWLTFQF